MVWNKVRGCRLYTGYWKMASAESLASTFRKAKSDSEKLWHEYSSSRRGIWRLWKGRSCVIPRFVCMSKGKLELCFILLTQVRKIYILDTYICVAIHDIGLERRRMGTTQILNSLISCICKVSTESCSWSCMCYVRLISSIVSQLHLMVTMNIPIKWKF